MQELKKENKILEDLNEKLDFIRKTWQSRGVAAGTAGAIRLVLLAPFDGSPFFSSPVEQNVGLAQSQALVEQECLRRAASITQTQKVKSYRTHRAEQKQLQSSGPFDSFNSFLHLFVQIHTFHASITEIPVLSEGKFTPDVN